MTDFLKNITAVKKFFYQIVDVLIDETNLDFKNLESTIDYYSDKNKTLKDFLHETNPNLKQLLVSFTITNHKVTRIVRKATAFVQLALYLNLCQFEIQFWAYLGVRFGQMLLRGWLSCWSDVDQILIQF